MAHDDPDINAAQHAESTANTQTVNEEERGGEGKDPDNTTTPQSDQFSDEKAPQDVPPDGGYGWVCVACAAFINGNTWGVNSVCLPSVFLSVLSSDIADIVRVSPSASSCPTIFQTTFSPACPP